MSGHFQPIPMHLEVRCVAHGGTVLRRIVEEVGGVSRAALLSGKTRNTILAWLEEEEPQIFGNHPQRLRSYRALSFSYPAPFPGLDRLCEARYGEGMSFLRVLSERKSFGLVLEDVRAPQGFGLELLREDWRSWLKLAREIEIPVFAVRGWREDALYPSIWRSLDLLAREVGQASWVEAVLASDPVKARCSPGEGGISGMIGAFSR